MGQQAFEATLAREAEGGYEVVLLGPMGMTVLGGPPLPADAQIALFSSPSGSLYKVRQGGTPAAEGWYKVLILKTMLLFINVQKKSQINWLLMELIANS